MFPNALTATPGLAEARAISPGAKVVFLSDRLIHRIRVIAQDHAARAVHKPNAHGLGKKNGVASPWENFLGEVGEQSLSKYLGIFHEPSPEKKGPDVRQYCVRCRSNHAWDLIIRDDDANHLHLPWVLASHVVGESFALLHGWGFGEELKKAGRFTDYGNNRPKAWFVHRRHLRPMETLPGQLVF